MWNLKVEKKNKLQQFKILLFKNYHPLTPNIIPIGLAILSLPVLILESGQTNINIHTHKVKTNQLVKEREREREKRVGGGGGG